MPLKKKVELLRKGDLVLHCVDVEVYQDIVGGMRLKGHGVIKINKVGTLYMEFVSTECENVPRGFFSERFPTDSLDEQQTLHLKARTVDGDIYESKGFSLDINFNTKSPPNLHYLIISSLSCRSDVEENKSTADNYLYFEFAENFNVPANKSNTETSTLGSESHTLNQTIIEIDSFQVSMVKHDNYTEVRVNGDFDIEEVRSCLIFYIGFSSASMPQLILMYQRTGLESVEVITSISNAQKRQRSSSPIVPHVSNKEHRGSQYHYDLFASTLHLYRRYPKRFYSVYSQWQRVWYAFQSQESIMILTLSVAIEGLLNDIFIPEIEQKADALALKAEIRKINSQIKKLELTEQQRQRLCNSVGHWGKVSALNALDYLIKHNIITRDDKDAWKKLRNDSAHPKIKKASLVAEKEEREKVLSCLNTFHKLLLNTLSYSGPIALFRSDKEYDLVEIYHQNVLG